MNYYVYILYSETIDNYCVGYTNDLKARLKEFNTPRRKGPHGPTDWLLVYQEECSSRQDAHKRELEIKWKRSRTYLIWLISFDTVNTNMAYVRYRAPVADQLSRLITAGSLLF